MLISSYIYIPVSDLEKAADWYEKNITSQMEYSTGQQPAYGFCVNDFDAVREKLEMNNVKIGEVFDYFGRSLSFYDLDGNKIEIWEDYEYDAR